MSKLALIKRYMMSHYNMTALECLPPMARIAIGNDKKTITMINNTMKNTRLIPTSEFNSLCKHMKQSELML